MRVWLKYFYKNINISISSDNVENARFKYFMTSKWISFNARI